MTRALRYLPLLILALAWEAIARTGLVSSSALPPLTKVAAAWLQLAGDREFWMHAGASLWRVAGGLFFAISIGVILGFAMARSRVADLVLSPFVSIFYPLPKSALIPVTALWLGFGDGSKILLIALGCMLPVTIGAYNGARSADRTLIWSARAMGANGFRVLRDVIAPSALPELLSGIRTALAISFVLLIASELVVARAGFGYLIGFLGSNGTYEPMFAVVLTVAFLGFVVDRLYQAMTRRVFAWRE